MKLLTNILLACMLIMGQLLHGQTPTFLSNFEDQNADAEIGTARFETGTSGGYKIVPNPSKDAYNSSDYVMKVFTNPGAGGRAEYQVSRHETLEKTYIYRWKRYYPSHMFDGMQYWGCLQNQWKTYPCTAGLNNVPASSICGAGGGIFNDMQLYTNFTGDYRSRAVPDCNFDFTEMRANAWHEYTLEIYWTKTEKGYYRIWRNDTLFGYSDNMKTLFGELIEGSCDIYWTTGLYSGFANQGSDSLLSYLDDIALYDIDKGFTIADVCPNCEVAPSTPTDSNVYKVNMHFSYGAPNGYTNYIAEWNGDTSKIDMSNTFGQSNGYDLYLWSGLSATSNSLSGNCFPEDVIQKAVQWSDTATHELLLHDLNPNNTYIFKVLSAGGNNSSAGLQIWTNEKNRDTLRSQGNTCNMAMISNLKPDAKGDLTIYTKTVGGTAYINAIEIVEYPWINNTHAIKNTELFELIIFPNPASDNLFVKVETVPSDITVYSYDGRKVKYAQNTKNIDIADLQTGVYIVLINVSNSFTTKLIIKE